MTQETTMSRPEMPAPTLVEDQGAQCAQRTRQIAGEDGHLRVADHGIDDRHRREEVGARQVDDNGTRLPDLSQINTNTSVEYGRSVKELTQKEAVQRSDVAKYVTARETYDPQDLATNTKLVRVMSDGNVWRQYEDEISQYNDSSPMKRYGFKVRRRIEVSTVLPLPNSENTYQVRYVAVEESPGSQMLPVERPYVSTIRFRYSDRPLSNEDRILNPLNFRALAYRKDQEISGPLSSQGKGVNP